METTKVKSNSSELKLLENWMVEIVKPGRYFRRMKRSEVAKLFQDENTWLQAEFQGASYNEETQDYFGNVFFDSSTESMAGKTRVTVGCTSFTGKNVEILRKWALKKASRG